MEWVSDKLIQAAMTPFRLIQNGIQYSRGETVGEKKTEFKILDNIDGVIKPGTMTILISPPGHGKSAFLKALANRLPAGSVKGDIKYGGFTHSECIAKNIHVGHLVQYVDQLDQHLPFLTVRETLDFVHQNANVDPANFGSSEQAENHKKRVDEILSLLHLKNCENTLVGNDILRGISGGEKKRLTVGEGLLTNARVLLMEYACM